MNSIGQTNEFASERRREMKRQLTISAIITMMMFVGICFAQNASADERGMRHHMGGMEGDGRPHGMMTEDEHPMWRHLMDLNLDEKQKAELKEIRSRIMKEMVKKKADERLAGIELKDLLDKDPVDMKAVEAKLKQIETIRTEIHLSHLRAREEVKSKLTPEQRKKFKETFSEMGPIMGGREMHEGMMRGGMRMPPPCEKEEMQ